MNKLHTVLRITLGLGGISWIINIVIYILENAYKGEALELFIASMIVAIIPYYCLKKAFNL